MSGIYGNMLLAWPEQMESLAAYQMTPRQGGGCDAVDGSNITFRGVVQNTTGQRLNDAGGNLVQSSGMELWTETGGLAGYFMQYEGATYRIGMHDNDWRKQGGFQRYALEKVIGNNGSEPDNTAWNTGYNSFS